MERHHAFSLNKYQTLLAIAVAYSLNTYLLQIGSALGSRCIDKLALSKRISSLAYRQQARPIWKENLIDRYSDNNNRQTSILQTIKLIAVYIYFSSSTFLSEAKIAQSYFTSGDGRSTTGTKVTINKWTRIHTQLLKDLLAFAQQMLQRTQCHLNIGHFIDFWESNLYLSHWLKVRLVTKTLFSVHTLAQITFIL